MIRLFCCYDAYNAKFPLRISVYVTKSINGIVVAVLSAFHFASFNIYILFHLFSSVLCGIQLQAAIINQLHNKKASNQGITILFSVFHTDFVCSGFTVYHHV
jgi:hypothetical protein